MKSENTLVQFWIIKGIVIGGGQFMFFPRDLPSWLSLSFSSFCYLFFNSKVSYTVKYIYCNFKKTNCFEYVKSVFWMKWNHPIKIKIKVTGYGSDHFRFMRRVSDVGAILQRGSGQFKTENMPDFCAAVGCSNERSAKTRDEGITFHRREVIF